MSDGVICLVGEAAVFLIGILAYFAGRTHGRFAATRETVATMRHAEAEFKRAEASCRESQAAYERLYAGALNTQEEFKQAEKAYRAFMANGTAS